MHIKAQSVWIGNLVLIPTTNMIKKKKKILKNHQAVQKKPVS